MKKNIAIITLIILTVISCEETVKNPDLPYQEQLVISGLLTNGESNPRIRISKTLHPLENFSYDKAIVKDAGATLDDGTNTYQLTFDDNEQQYIAEGLTPEIGKSYTLTVNWKNKTVKGYTYIPDTCEFLRFDYTISEEYYNDNRYDEYVYTIKIYAVIKAKEGAVYAADGSPYFDDFFNNCLRYEDKNSKEELKILLENISYWSNDKITNYNVILDKFKKEFANYTTYIYSIHPDFYKYFNTKYDGQMNDFIFGTSGKNVQGNIKNAIGFFYGNSFITRKLELSQ